MTPRSACAPWTISRGGLRSFGAATVRVLALSAATVCTGCLSVAPSFPTQPASAPPVVSTGGAVETDESVAASTASPAPSEAAVRETASVPRSAGWSRLWEPFQRSRPIPLPQTHETGAEPPGAHDETGF